MYENSEPEILIIGAGLTGLTIGYYLVKAGKKVLLIEKEDRVGGVINTVKEDGFTFESGPNTGTVSTPELVALFDDLHGHVKPEIANPAANNRWILKNGKWYPLPSGFFQGVTTPLFTVKDKLRIMGEPFRRPGTDPLELVADMVVRRLGRSFLDYAVDPFISGIYAGDPGRLVTRYALPKLYKLEQDYGSFIRGALKKRKEPKTELEKKATKEVFSVKGGLKGLTDGLYHETGPENIITGCSGIEVKPDKNGFITRFKNKGNKPAQITSPFIVTTTGAYELPSILPFIDENDLHQITRLHYSGVVQVVAAYHTWEGIKLNAFGGLIPSKENRQSLGILFPSTLFEGRAPEKGAILSVFLGGMKGPDIINKSDNEITQIVLSEIRDTLKCSGKPDLLKIYRYDNAIAQYEKDSGDRLEAIDHIQNKYQGLVLAGNIRDGIGIADRVKQGRKVADMLIDREPLGPEEINRSK